MVRGQISTPRGSETLEQISMKLGVYNYFPDVTTHTNPYGTATTWVVWANSQFATVTFLSVSFFVPCSRSQVAL